MILHKVTDLIDFMVCLRNRAWLLILLNYSRCLNNALQPLFLPLVGYVVSYNSTQTVVKPCVVYPLHGMFMFFIGWGGGLHPYNNRKETVYAYPQK